MGRQKLTHSVRGEVDVEMAVALGAMVTATCGKRWVPTMTGDECDALDRCPICYPPPRRAKKEQKRRSAEAIAAAARPHYVYRCYDAADRLVYVGCSATPRNRMYSHQVSSWWYPEVERVTYRVFPSRQYALAREREAISTENPRFNIKGRWRSRSLWSADDYADYFLAVTNGTPGSHYNRTHLAKVTSEAQRRYGLELVAS